MLARLRDLLPTGRAIVWTVAALVFGPPLVLGLMLLAAVVLNVEMTLDVAHVLWAVTGTLVAVGLVLWIRHRMRPKETVAVNYSFKLEQPLTPLGRYQFRLEVFYEVEQKGERRKVEQGTIEMAFRKRDHPEIFEWCRVQIRTQLASHRSQALERYPDARVVVADLPEPAALESAGDSRWIGRF